MAAIGDPGVPGFFAPVHRALTDPILMAGAPRTVAIANGTLAAAIALGLRLWIPGALIWVAGHARSPSGRPSAIPQVRGCGAPPSALSRTWFWRVRARMLNLAEYRNRPAGPRRFSCPGRRLVAEGVVLNKDGSFQRTARFRGPDLDSATPAELVGVTARLNNALRRLGSGWAIFVEAQRIAAQTYPHSAFPDPASALVDLERQDAFEEAGAHFESRYFLTLVWLPPAEDASRVEGWLYEGRSQSGVDPWELLHGFVDRTNRVLQLVEGFMPEVSWLDDGETLTYLHSTISTRSQRVRVPETPMHLDALLADEPLAGGLEPRLGVHHLRTLTVVGFPTTTHPGILDELNRLAFPYRWSTRAILLDKTEAVKLLTKIRRQWFAKRKSIAAIVKEVMTNEASVAGRFRCRQQGHRCRHGVAGAGHRRRGPGLRHRHRHGLGRGRQCLAAEKLRLVEKVIQSQRLHLHAGRGERTRGVARAPCPATPTPMSASRRSRR